MKEPKVHVGIMFEPQINFVLLNLYRFGEEEVSGLQTVTYQDGRIHWNGNLYDELLFEPMNEATDAFELQDVTIGINFHWERKENQRFIGALKIIVENEKLTGINVINVEDYLTSVISSEMSATASLELLKAHAVISRGWLLAQIQKNKELTETQTEYSAFTQTEDELIRWYDREDHTRFDVCADDHCQRYQGLTRATGATVRKAIDSTWGQVLMHDGALCDARFSKCCGGRMELFSTCWEDKDYPYLQPLPDTPGHAEGGECFCSTQDKVILGQVLNGYDQETTDFYRWKVEYDRKELGELIALRSGRDIGTVVDMEPLQRGPSGRIYNLRITGEKGSLVVGKELEIRRTLSDSHLFSSAFVVDKGELKEGVPQWFLLSGAG